MAVGLTVRPERGRLGRLVVRSAGETILLANLEQGFAAEYVVRPGVEGALSQGVRVCGLLRSPSRFANSSGTPARLSFLTPAQPG